jgi:protein ImuA
LALILARAAQAATGGVIVWSDPRRQLHPPAVSAAGIDLRRMILLRPRNAAQEISALTECLRCKGVSATVANLNRLSDIEARRLQLAAENGGGVGIFLRPSLRPGSTSSSGNYAAATRWLVRPALERDDRQSWIVELLHGHGGRLGSSVLLEVDRETGDVRASAPLADRPAAAPQTRATA